MVRETNKKFILDLSENTLQCLNSAFAPIPSIGELSEVVSNEYSRRMQKYFLFLNRILLNSVENEAEILKFYEKVHF